MKVESKPPEQEELPLVLPELQEAILQGSQLEEYLGDLELCAEELRCQIKGAMRAEPSTIQGPAALKEHLQSEGFFGAQLTYGFKGRLYIDTLLKHPDGVRLVRTEAPTP